MIRPPDVDDRDKPGHDGKRRPGSRSRCASGGLKESIALTVMTGLVWGFFCQEGFRIFFASSLFQGGGVGTQIGPRPGPPLPCQREAAWAGPSSRPKPPEAGAEG